MAGKGHKPGKKVHIREGTGRLLLAGLVLSCALMLVFTVSAVVRNVGRQSLRKHSGEVADAALSAGLSGETPEEETEGIPVLEEGQILVNGEVWEYDDTLLTFLCMGVDSRKGITKSATPGTAGQADALFLAVMEPATGKVRLLSLNRDTMTDIEIYDTAGMYLGKEKGQLALQYAYGDGREDSCRLMEQAVSRLLYGIPVHGYAALDMQAIATLNDAVGGVEVTLPEDMTRWKADWTKGTRVHLMGEDALLYVQRRDTAYLGTNLGRVERQKQYLGAYAGKLKEKMQEEALFPLTLYGTVKEHTVTSLTVQEMTYLAGLLSETGFFLEDMVSLPGESRMGEEKEEFYVDEAALKQLVIETFYKKAGQEGE